MKIYLAGPMRGYPQFNFPAFDEAAKALRAQGHEVFSPADHDRKTYGSDVGAANPTGDEAQAGADYGFDIRKAMKDDLSWICEHADAIAILPGWNKSTGATAERAAAIAIHIPIFYLDPGESYAIHS